MKLARSAAVLLVVSGLVALKPLRLAAAGYTYTFHGDGTHELDGTLMVLANGGGPPAIADLKELRIYDSFIGTNIDCLKPPNFISDFSVTTFGSTGYAGSITCQVQSRGTSTVVFAGSPASLDFHPNIFFPGNPIGYDLSGAWSVARTVTTTNDNGPGSLRQAILDSASGDTIDFLVTGMIGLTSGELLVTNSLTISGPRSDRLAITGGGATRLFEIGATAGVNISGLSLRDGYAGGGTAGIAGHAAGGPGGNGGAILNFGSLTLSNCVVTNNGAGSGGAGFQFAGFGSPAPSGSGGNGGSGGAIWNGGSLVLEDCAITGNLAGSGGSGGSALSLGFTSYNAGNGGVGGDGGAIFNSNSIALYRCTFSFNAPGTGGNGGSGPQYFPGVSGYPGGGGNGGAGGAISSSGTIIGSGNTFNTNASANGGFVGGGNTAVFGTQGANGGNGGAIFSSGTLELTNCTFAGNACGAGTAGGIGNGYVSSYIGSGGGGGNGGSGGAICSSGAMNLVACTFVQNSSGNGGPGGPGSGPVGGYGGGGGNGGAGGAICNQSSAGAAILHNVLIATNSNGAGGGGGAGSTGNGSSGLTGVGSDLSGSFTSAGFNLVSIPSGSFGVSNGVNSDLTGIGSTALDARLDSLAANGGPTATIGLLPGSPALDAGDDGLLLAPFNITNDQRNVPRLAGSHVDIGAFEFQAVSLPPVVSGAVLPGSAGFRISFSSAPGATFTVLGTKNVSSPLSNWTLLGPATVTAPGQFEFIDSIIQARSFYRVRSP